MAEYYIGQIFVETYPIEAVVWCSENNAYMGTISPLNDKQRFQIKEQEPYVPTPEEIDKLTMTALDFIGVLEGFSLNYITQIKPFLEANKDLDKQLKYCQNVYCGVAKQAFIKPITIDGITITAEMVEKAFRDKHGV